MTHLITTTMQPGRVVEVSDQELVDLERMGIVASRIPTELSQVPAPTPLIHGEETRTDGDSQEEESEADRGQAAPAEDE